MRQSIQSYVHNMLSCCSDAVRSRSSHDSFQDVWMAERLRREAHALCLQCGFWISGSPQHVREWEATHVNRECILQNSLMRSIVLAERLLPALIGDSASVEEALAEIRQVSERIGFAVNPDVYPGYIQSFLVRAAKIRSWLGCASAVVRGNLAGLRRRERTPLLVFGIHSGGAREAGISTGNGS